MSDLLIIFFLGCGVGSLGVALVPRLFLWRECVCGWRCATWHHMVHHVEMKHVHKE